MKTPTSEQLLREKLSVIISDTLHESARDIYEGYKITPPAWAGDPYQTTAINTTDILMSAIKDWVEGAPDVCFTAQQVKDNKSVGYFTHGGLVFQIIEIGKSARIVGRLAKLTNGGQDEQGK